MLTLIRCIVNYFMDKKMTNFIDKKITVNRFYSFSFSLLILKTICDIVFLNISIKRNDTCFLKLLFTNRSMIKHSIKGIWADAVVCRIIDVVVVQVAIIVHVPRVVIITSVRRHRSLTPIPFYNIHLSL